MASPAQTDKIAELEKQLAEIQKKNKELTDQLGSLKKQSDRTDQATQGAGSSGSH